MPSQENSLTVKQPLFFKVTHKGKTAYILGTNHILSLNVLPEECINIIKTCQSFVGEGTDPSIEELADFQNNFLKYYGRRVNDVDWFERITAEQQQLCQQYFDSFLETTYGSYAPKVSVGKVRLSTAINCIEYACRSLLPSMLSENEDQSEDETCDQSKQNNVSDEIFGEMDIEICALFDKAYGLEDHFNVMRLDSEAEGEFEDLIDYLSLIQKATSGEASDDLSEDDNDSDEYFQEILNRYYQGGHLTDFAKARELDEEDAADNNKMQRRNQIFFTSMLQHMEELPGPIVVAMGAEHLIGKSGILMQLDSYGIPVELYDPNHSNGQQFQKFEYQYKNYLSALENTKRALLFTPRQPVLDVTIHAQSNRENFTVPRYKN